MTVAQAQAWTDEVVRHLPPRDRVLPMVMPPFTAISAVAQRRASSTLGLGAQDLFPAAAGAFTGEIGTDLLKDLAVDAVLVGHSERRRYLGETDELVARKVETALGAGFEVVLCVGETSLERNADLAGQVIETQVTRGLDRIARPELARITIAYEPVWAIGSGTPASPAEASQAAALVRSALEARFGDQAGDDVSVLYGGSVDEENFASFLAAPGVDGALVGGASLSASRFCAMLKVASE